MITYSKATSTLQTLTGVPSTDAATTATLVQFWNDSRRTVASINGGKWPWLEVDEYALTVANREYVEIPNNIRRVITARQQNGVTVGSVIYPLRLIFDQQKWDAILATLLGKSNVPFFAYQRDTKLYIQPIPSHDGDLVYMRGRLKLVDLNIPDYTTGTIDTATNGSTTVIGSSTFWTSNMAGRYIQIASSGNNNWGDNAWYQIASITGAGTLELTKPYQGATLFGVPTYTIAQITYEPESYHMAPIYRAVAQYWDLKEDMTLSQRYWRLYDGGVEAGLSKEYGGLVSQMLEEANESMEGSYMSPLSRDGGARSNWPPYWFPYDDATGF